LLLLAADEALPAAVDRPSERRRQRIKVTREWS
jgi:hypothetical protein